MCPFSSTAQRSSFEINENYFLLHWKLPEEISRCINTLHYLMAMEIYIYCTMSNKYVHVQYITMLVDWSEIAF